MNITEKDIIGEVVAQDYRTAPVFKNHGIDFCCNGNRTIEDACNEIKTESSILIEKLQQAVHQSNNTEIQYNLWPLDLLADYVEKKHHRYVEQKIQEITPFLNKVVRVHGVSHPELLEVEQLFHETAGGLTAHMKKRGIDVVSFYPKNGKSTNQ